MQNNRNSSDFADVHTDLSTDAVTPLKYLIMKIIATCICTYTDLPNTLTVSQAGKINRSSNFIGLSFIMLVTANN